jgi:D-alanine-D-alanine ligase
MRILLLGGGSSGEHNVSRKSAAAMEKGLSQAGHQVDLVIIKNEKEALQLWDSRDYDFMMLGLHGKNSEDGYLQNLLESRGIPFSGASSVSSKNAFFKSKTKQMMRKSGILTADWELFKHVPGEDLPITKLSIPYVIKPDNDGSTLGLSIIKNEESLTNAKAISGEYEYLLYEKFIFGRELTVSVIGQHALPIVEIFPGHELYDYESKYTSGMSQYVCPADLSDDITEDIQKIALKVMKAVGVEVYGRVDFRLDEENNAYCLEVNTLPGMTETSLFPKAAKAHGMSFSDLLDEIVTLSLEKS